MLTVDASTVGAATIIHGENVLTYQRIVDILPALTPQINRALLIGQGLLALNFVAFLEDGKKKALASVAKTLAQIFPHQQVFISEPDTEFNDFIFLAAHQAIEYDNGIIPAEQRHWLKARHITIDQSPGTVLTDNLNPLEMLQIRKSEQYRRLIVELLGIDHFIR